MKIRIWTAITDGGDGEYHTHIYKSKQEMVDALSLTDDDGRGYAFDEYDYPVQYSSSIFDISGYEVVEE